MNSASRDHAPSISGATYIQVRIEPDMNSGCWIWGLSLDSDGYGRATFPGLSDKAHRASWEVYRGPIPSGLHVLHSCDTPACVNPGHLRLGTHVDNMADLRARGRKPLDSRAWANRTHCANGHEINPETTYVKPNGKHQCRLCMRAMRNTWKRTYRAKNRAVADGDRSRDEPK